MLRVKFHYAWVICCACFIIMIFTAPLVNACASLYLIPVVEEFSISRSAFTLTSTLVAICGMVFSPIWGKVYSKWSMRWVITIALAGFGLGYMSYSLAKALWQLYFSAIIVGIFYSGCAFMPVSMLITAWFKRQRGLAMSLALGGIGIGGGIFSPLITSLIQQWGWRTSYQIIGLSVLVVAMPVAALFLRIEPKAISAAPFGAESDHDEKKSGRAKAPVIQNDARDVSLKEAKSQLFFYVHLLAMLLLGLICSAPLRQISPFVSDIHGPQTAAVIVSLYSLVGIFGKLILGWLNDCLGTMRGALVAMLLMIGGFTCLAFGNSLWVFYLMSILYGIGNGVGTVSAPLLISATFGTKSFNVMRGLTQSPMQLGMSMGGLLVALSYDLSGSYRYGWGGCIIISILSILCFFIARNGSARFATKRDGEVEI